MRSKMAAAALISLGALAATATTTTTAEARDGCGPGFHLGWRGFCKPNWRPYAYRPIVYARPVVVGYGWRRPWGWRHAGWHRPWGYRGGWNRVGFYGHRGWHHRW